MDLPLKSSTQPDAQTDASFDWLRWLEAIPAPLMPLVARDLLKAYSYLAKRVCKPNQKRSIVQLANEFGRKVLRWLRAGDPVEPDGQKLLQAYLRAGLSASLGKILADVKGRHRQSRLLETLAADIECETIDAKRALWIAYALDPKPGKAEKLAKRLFKMGDINSAVALLGLGVCDHSDDPILRELRLNAHQQSHWPALAKKSQQPRRSSSGRLSVAYVAASALPCQMTGYTVRTHSLLKALLRQDIETKCITRPGFPWDRPRLHCDALLAESEKLDEVEYIFTRIAGSHQPEFTIDVMSQALERRFEAQMPTIVHAASNHRNALPALIAARRLGLPFFYEMRGLWELTAASRNPGWGQTERFQLERRLEIFVAKEADQVFVITNGLANELIGSGVPEEKISLLPNAVDPELFRPTERDPELQARLALDNGDFVLVYAGSLTSYEGLDDLITAVGILRRQGTPTRLIIVGDGAVREELQALAIAEELQSAVTFCGIVPHDDTRAYLALADAIALPRKPFRVCEIVTPLKPFEAMAMAKPVVLSDLPALREIVTDEKTGRLCSPGDPVSLASVLQELASNPNMRADLGSAARDWIIANRSWAGNASRLKDCYVAYSTQKSALSSAQDN